MSIGIEGVVPPQESRKVSDLKFASDINPGELEPNIPVMVKHIVEGEMRKEYDDLVREIVEDINNGRMVIQSKGKGFRIELEQKIKAKIAFKQSMEESRN